MLTLVVGEPAAVGFLDRHGEHVGFALVAEASEERIRVANAASSSRA